MPHIQIPDMILPQVHPLYTEVETIADALEHVSLPLETVAHLDKKAVYIYATMVAAPGNLHLWIETAPYDFAATYVLLGVPTIIGATGDVILIWRAHSSFARLVCQVPVFGAGAWVLQAYWEGS